jgi:hypothetical protein
MAAHADGIARNLDRDTVLAARLETAGSLSARFWGLMGRPALPAGDGLADGLWLPASNGIHMMFMRFPSTPSSVPPGWRGVRRVLLHRGLRPGPAWCRWSAAQTAWSCRWDDRSGTVGDRVEVSSGRRRSRSRRRSAGTGGLLVAMGRSYRTGWRSGRRRQHAPCGSAAR